MSQLLGFFYVIKNARYTIHLSQGDILNHFMEIRFFIYKLFDIKIVISAFR